MTYRTFAKNEAANEWVEGQLPPLILARFKRWREEAISEKDPNGEALIGAWLSEITLGPTSEGVSQLGYFYAVIFTWSQDSGKEQELAACFLLCDSAGNVNGFNLTVNYPTLQ